MATSAQPRGIRNNNPGNIRWGDPWQGLVDGPRTDSAFCVFKAPVWGIRAIVRILITYQDKGRAADGSKIDSVAEIIARWAPPNENNTGAYANAVAAFLNQPAGLENIDVQKYEQVRPIVEGIIRHENGKGPLSTTNTWYDDATIDEGLRLAGVKKEVSTVAAVPVTKESAAATATGALGIAQLADMAPQINAALSSSQDNLSSGSIVRLVIGVLTIGFAIFIAYSQVKKHQQSIL